VLYESDLRGTDPLETLRDRQAQADPPVSPYAAELVRGVCAHRGELDSRIAELAAEGWTLARLPPVDRNLLRLAGYELLHRDDVPPGVVISEAVGLAASLSTTESARFVNGVLARLDSSRGERADHPGVVPVSRPDH
jgi:N utilization substance protein B